MHKDANQNWKFGVPFSTTVRISEDVKNGKKERTFLYALRIYHNSLPPFRYIFALS